MPRDKFSKTMRGLLSSWPRLFLGEDTGLENNDYEWILGKLEKEGMRERLISPRHYQDYINDSLRVGDLVLKSMIHHELIGHHPTCKYMQDVGREPLGNGGGHGVFLKFGVDLQEEEVIT